MKKLLELYNRASFPSGTTIRAEADKALSIAAAMARQGVQRTFTVGRNFLGKVKGDKVFLLRISTSKFFYSATVGNPSPGRVLIAAFRGAKSAGASLTTQSFELFFADGTPFSSTQSYTLPSEVVNGVTPTFDKIFGLGYNTPQQAYYYTFPATFVCANKNGSSWGAAIGMQTIWNVQVADSSKNYSNLNNYCSFYGVPIPSSFPEDTVPPVQFTSVANYTGSAPVQPGTMRLSATAGGYVWYYTQGGNTYQSQLLVSSANGMETNMIVNLPYDKVYAATYPIAHSTAVSGLTYSAVDPTQVPLDMVTGPYQYLLYTGDPTQPTTGKFTVYIPPVYAQWYAAYAQYLSDYTTYLSNKLAWGMNNLSTTDIVNGKRYPSASAVGSPAIESGMFDTLDAKRAALVAQYRAYCKKVSDGVLAQLEAGQMPDVVRLEIKRKHLLTSGTATAPNWTSLTVRHTVLSATTASYGQDGYGSYTREVIATYPDGSTQSLMTGSCTTRSIYHDEQNTADAANSFIEVQYTFNNWFCYPYNDLPTSPTKDYVLTDANIVNLFALAEYQAVAFTTGAALSTILLGPSQTVMPGWLQAAPALIRNSATTTNINSEFVVANGAYRSYGSGLPAYSYLAGFGYFGDVLPPFDSSFKNTLSLSLPQFVKDWRGSGTASSYTAPAVWAFSDDYLCDGEQITVVPVSFMMGDVELGVYPQNDDKAAITAVKLTKAYTYTYSYADGTFALSSVKDIVGIAATTDSNLPNFVFVSLGTVYDDLQIAYDFQAAGLTGQYVEGQLTLCGLYDFVSKALAV